MPQISQVQATEEGELRNQSRRATWSRKSLEPQNPIKRTPLYDLHLELGGKIVPFAGYEMPVQYPLGVMGEHLHTRAKAGLFDVSHMGQAKLTAEGKDAAAVFESLVPGGIETLQEGRMRYTQLTNETGGIRDDLMATRFGDTLWLVVNAACKEDDFAHISSALEGQAALEIADRALLALQGPAAGEVLAQLMPASTDLVFMQAAWANWSLPDSGQSVDVLISRCGYTGEDGFELSIAPEHADILARTLLAHADVEPIGLGARDSLRLEAGLCLYGHDIDLTTSPAEADLLWSVPKRRRAQANFPGAETLNQHIENGVTKKRVGILPEGRAPAREGTQIESLDGEPLGQITSGGFGPTLGGPLAMGYVPAAFSLPDTQIHLIVRGKALPARVAAMPFVPQNYRKG
ncbi:MAG: glycine cleavage system aminomethyltransferase GcvT [Rhodobiaceae bacterium]|jgi:aminomethyltransferase|nr:glycine cleavage system aminomethyltransferase GcvT [Rhodobiaceae bacterium]